LPVIESVVAREILDCRGRPTVEACCTLTGGAEGVASVPSGASTGSAEAHELRDRDPRRYGGYGCLRAVANVNDEINAVLHGKDWASQDDLDHALIALDGTPQKSRLGANAILSVSLAFARASAAAQRVPLWRYFASLIHRTPSTMPRLTINLFSGGMHAGGQVEIQDALIVPLSASSVSRSLEMAYDVYAAAARICAERYNMRLLRADEGGMAPPFASIEEMLETTVEAIARAGYQPGSDVAMAVDVASTHFHHGGVYRLGGVDRTSSQMIELLQSWVNRFPIVSVEDGLAEDDWNHWPALHRMLDHRALTLGDDLLATQTARIRRAIDGKAANALLLKVNQCGTLTEAAEAYLLARSAGWHVTLSVRSGDTEDSWPADLATGWGADHFKGGSITQSERLAKYNRLMALEVETGFPVTSDSGQRTRPSASPPVPGPRL
jgi:enolase